MNNCLIRTVQRCSLCGVLLKGVWCKNMGFITLEWATQCKSFIVQCTKLSIECINYTVQLQ